jgi:hypothetical protein
MDIKSIRTSIDVPQTGRSILIAFDRALMLSFTTSTYDTALSGNTLTGGSNTVVFVPCHLSLSWGLALARTRPEGARSAERRWCVTSAITLDAMPPVEIVPGRVGPRRRRGSHGRPCRDRASGAKVFIQVAPERAARKSGYWDDRAAAGCQSSTPKQIPRKNLRRLIDVFAVSSVGRVRWRQRVPDHRPQIVAIQSGASQFGPAIMTIFATMNLPHAIRLYPRRPPVRPHARLKFPI